jgi:hypothetical protein
LVCIEEVYNLALSNKTKLNKMKAKLKTLTAQDVEQVLSFERVIYYRTGLKGNFKIFLDKSNEPFYDITDAIKYFRNNREYYDAKFNLSRYYMELSELTSALHGHGQWDNI